MRFLVDLCRRAYEFSLFERGERSCVVGESVANELMSVIAAYRFRVNEEPDQQGALVARSAGAGTARPESSAC